MEGMMMPVLYLFAIADEVGLEDFGAAVLTAYLPGWKREWTDENTAEAIDTLTAALFGA